MNPQDDYNYETSGFDGFFNRSIDGLSQDNLDAGGPTKTENRQDSSQISGKAGDIWRLGRVQIDAGGIKVSQEGTAVEQAEEHQIIFNTSDNLFKIVDVVRGTYSVTAADLSATLANFSFQNTLGRVPDKVTGMLHMRNINVPSLDTTQELPFNYFPDSGEYFDDFAPPLLIYMSNITDTTIYCKLRIMDLAGISVLTSSPTLEFTFYLMDMTNPPD